MVSKCKTHDVTTDHVGGLRCFPAFQLEQIKCETVLVDLWIKTFEQEHLLRVDDDLCIRETDLIELFKSNLRLRDFNGYCDEAKINNYIRKTIKTI